MWWPFSFALSFLVSEDDLLLVMPTSKTIYESFDGKEFQNEEDAKTYEEDVRRCGVELREKFLTALGGHDIDYLSYIEPKLLELVKSYPDEDAWLIMRSLCNAKSQMAYAGIHMDTDWLAPYVED